MATIDHDPSKDIGLVKAGVIQQVAKAPTSPGAFGAEPDGSLVDLPPGCVAGQLWNGTTASDPPPPAPTKESLSAYAVSARWLAMTAGILFDSNPIPTDDVGRGLINGAYDAALADPTATKNWQISNAPIAFVTFTNAQLRALGLAANAMVQACFDVLKTVGEQIEAGTITTTAQIDTAFGAIQRVYTTPA